MTFHPDFGDVPTWLGGIGAGIAAWAAFRTLLTQRKQLRDQETFINEQRVFIAEQSGVLGLQRDALIEDAADRRTAQARRIRVDATIRSTWEVVVTNLSDQPIHDVDARFGGTYPTSEAIVEGTSQAREVRSGLPIAILGPGRTALLKSPTLSEAAMEGAPPTVTFTGVDGSEWETDQHNHLRPAPAP